MAATDGHAKELQHSAVHRREIRAGTLVRDVLSAWPIIGNGKNHLAWKNVKLAMAVSGKNRHYNLATVMRRHFNATAAKCGWGETAEDMIGELLTKVDDAIESVSKQLPDGFPEDVATAIFEGMRSQAKQLQEQPAAPVARMTLDTEDA